MTPGATRRLRAALAAAAMLASLAGCAPRAVLVKPHATPAAPPAVTPAAPTAVATPPTTTPAPRRFVPADSLPSRDAIAVLATIPEPIPGVNSDAPRPRRAVVPAEPPVPQPRPVPLPESVVATKPAASAASATPPVSSAKPDTPAVAAPKPVAVTPPVTPAPSKPVEAAPKPTPTPPAPKPAPVVLPARPPASPPESDEAPPDTCLRVQFAAPSERVRAEALRDAAQSVLMAPMTIELEDGRWKVRLRDCQTRPAVEALRKRAVDSGLAGAFIIRVPPR